VSNLQLVALAAYGILLWVVYQRFDAITLVRERSRAAAFFNSFVLLLIMWLFRLKTELGPDIHFLLTSALTLTLGFRGAVLCASLVLFTLLLAGQQLWAQAGVLGLTSIAAPICVTYSIYALTFHKIPRHFLVYIFACAFIPAALGIALHMGLYAGYLALDGIYHFDLLQDNYLGVIPLLLFPEALLNGMAMTLLVLYKPQWVYTFSDKLYFDVKDDQD